MKGEQITKLVKAGVVLLGLIGIEFSADQASGFSNAIITVGGGVFAVAYALEAWWKKQGK